MRATARGHGTVGEYSVSTDLPDRTAFARWLDQSIAQARLAETGCAVLLVHIADFREVDEVFGGARGRYPGAGCRGAGAGSAGAARFPGTPGARRVRSRRARDDPAQPRQ
ncbi:hypothetical protein ACU4GD_04210 [Cupriavidus basilensis]